MHTFKKKSNLSLSKHFNSNEFDCKCSYDTCLDQLVSEELVSKLELVRTEFNEPLLITSAFRCDKKQQDLRGTGTLTAKGKSTHELGHAVDIKPLKTTEENFKRLLEVLAKHFDAIGLAKTFYHVDLRTDKKNRRWDY